MDISQDIIFALKKKYGNIDSAAKALGMSRSTLYAKVDRIERDKDFQQLIMEKSGIDVNKLGGVKSPDAQAREKKIGNIEMRYNVVRLKNDRVVEVWLPSDFGKTDVKTVESWLDLIESTL